MGGRVIGDSRDITVLVETIAADFVFSCPPYADLEVYSDDPRDLPFPSPPILLRFALHRGRVRVLALDAMSRHRNTFEPRKDRIDQMRVG
jgi:hypothetical protein